MFQPGTTVVVSVSGGPDSLCLLDSLARLRRLLAIELACFHFDHRLRQGSERDALYVRRHAQRLGLPFFLREAEASPPPGESVEAWARSRRYAALRSVREAVGARSAAVGHTADDQAETVLLALLRGGGLDALAAMRPVRGSVVRPLLQATREETVAYCRALGFKPRLDPMNEDRSYLRVAIRKEVIPFVERSVGRSVRGPLSRSASLLAEDADFLDQLAGDAALNVVGHDDGDTLLAVSALKRLPRPVATRLIRRAALDIGLLMEAPQVDAVYSLIRSDPGRRVVLPGGLLGSREKEYVRLSRPSPGTAASGEPPPR